MSCIFQLVVFTNVNICFIDDNCKEKCIKAIRIKETSKDIAQALLPFDDIMTICLNIGVGYVALLVSHKTFISIECSFITTIVVLNLTPKNDYLLG
jgi:hypothetical protein